MTHPEPLPHLETKSPPVGEVGHEHRLHRGALGILDISAATMANIGPAMSFFFGFGFLAETAGLASPLTIVAAGIAIALLGNTLAQFSRAQPSTGGFITFVGKAFGPVSAVTTALLAGAGYIIAMASVIAVSGGFMSITVEHYLHVNIPWGIFTVIFTALAVYMMIRGVSVSTRLAGLFFGIEMTVLVIVSVAVIVKNAGHLSLAVLGPVRAQEHHERLSPASPQGSRWRSTCSSAGRTPRRSPRKPTTRAATCPAPSSARLRSCRSATSFSRTRR